MIDIARALGISALAMLSLTAASTPPIADAATLPASVQAVEGVQVTGPVSPATLLDASPSSLGATDAPAAIARDDAELQCLATAVYFEARGETRVGQIAVAQVIVNRARSGRFAATICGVIAQRGQFSFAEVPIARRNAGQWARARDVARLVAAGDAANPVGGALFFHASHVAPGWSRTEIASIGNHRFYR